MTQYKKGDYVRYAASGVCLIEEIKSMELKPGKSNDFYILKPLQNKNSTLYVPVNSKPLLVKMRHFLTKDEIDEIIASSKGKELSWIEDRKERSENFRKVLAEGNVQQLIELVSCIYLKKVALKAENKKLSSYDEDSLTKAQESVENEFSFVLNLTGEEVGKYIRNILGIKD